MAIKFRLRRQLNRSFEMCANKADRAKAIRTREALLIAIAATEVADPFSTCYCSPTPQELEAARATLYCMLTEL
jgi:hypothetical protein